MTLGTRTRRRGKRRKGKGGKTKLKETHTVNVSESTGNCTLAPFSLRCQSREGKRKRGKRKMNVKDRSDQQMTSAAEAAAEA